jgi:hypothetical protein
MKTLDSDPDSLEMPDPDSLNPDPQHWLDLLSNRWFSCKMRWFIIFYSKIVSVKLIGTVGTVCVVL